jgi:hypothetical protein
MGEDSAQVVANPMCMMDHFTIGRPRYRLKPVIYEDILRIAAQRQLPVTIAIKGGWIRKGIITSARHIKRGVGVVHIKETGRTSPLSERHAFIRLEDIAAIDIECSDGQLDDLT